VALNKIDDPEVRAGFRRSRPASSIQLMQVSALARTDITGLLHKAVRAQCPRTKAGAGAASGHKPAEDRATTGSPTKAPLAPSGTAIERAANMTYWEHEGSVRRFQKLMQALGVDDALRKSGIQEGDTVAVGDYELDWQD
jgi:GTP-binding protein